ncbi:MAG: FapA family protein [Syntrophomonadaceae bacterium]|nr:FapA family protein [Syntrophomonadaceae bacterium]
MSEADARIDGQVRVSFGPGKMQAFVEVTAPVGEGAACTREQLMKALAEAGVIYNISEQAVGEALQEINRNNKILVARGTDAVAGEDGRLIVKFPLPKERIGPKVDEKGNANYYDLGMIHNVKTGELLVERVPPTEGIPGTDVTGNAIIPKKGKDYRLPRGKNTVADEEELRLYAICDGHVNIIDGKVVVDSALTIARDIDFSTGNVDFIGDVIILGNVTNGFKVKAAGNIQVNGFIEGAEVTAGGDIIVKGGITTGIKGYVKAEKNVYARFVENSRVEAGGDAIISEAIMQSYVKAGGIVKVNERRATIVGGVIQASYLVEAKVLGSQLATQTTVEVGINPYYREEYQQLIRQGNEKRKQLDALNHNLQVYQRSGISTENLPDSKRLALIKMLDEFKTLRQELVAMDERINYLEGEFERGHAARVRALEIAYPGVRISIGHAIYTVNDPIKYSEFILEEGDVRLTSLR